MCLIGKKNIMFPNKVICLAKQSTLPKVVPSKGRKWVFEMSNSLFLHFMGKKCKKRLIDPSSPSSPPYGNDFRFPSHHSTYNQS